MVALVLIHDIHFREAFASQTVKVEPVKMERIQERRKVTGSLRAVSRAKVAALEEGRVIAVLVNEGSFVKKGQILVRVDARRLNAQLEETRAELAMAQAVIAQRDSELKNSRVELKRQESLIKSGIATEQRYRDVLTAVEVAEARSNASRRDLKRIQSRINLLKIRLNDTVVRAPFEGRIVERQAEPGEWIRPGDPLVTLVSTKTIEAWLEVPERYAAPVRENAKSIQVQILTTKKSVPSLSTRIVPQVDPRARTFYLVAELEGLKNRLVPGMSVTAWVPTGTLGNRMTLSKDAVLRDGVGFYVFKAARNTNGQYQAQRIPVRILFETSQRMIVSSTNLAKGDFVVVEGNERLLPQTAINFAQAQATPTAAESFPPDEIEEQLD